MIIDYDAAVTVARGRVVNDTACLATGRALEYGSSLVEQWLPVRLLGLCIALHLQVGSNIHNTRQRTALMCCACTA